LKYAIFFISGLLRASGSYQGAWLSIAEVCSPCKANDKLGGALSSVSQLRRVNKNNILIDTNR
jgi:hypothetical protein